MVTETRIDTETVLEVEDLRTYFTTRWGTVGVEAVLRSGGCSMPSGL